MMRTATLLALAAVSLAALSTPAQADVQGQIENLVGEVPPPSYGCRTEAHTGLTVCYRLDEECSYVSYRHEQGRGTVFAGC